MTQNEETVYLDQGLKNRRTPGFARSVCTNKENTTGVAEVNWAKIFLAFCLCHRLHLPPTTCDVRCGVLHRIDDDLYIIPYYASPGPLCEIFTFPGDGTNDISFQILRRISPRVRRWPPHPQSTTAPKHSPCISQLTGLLFLVDHDHEWPPMRDGRVEQVNPPIFLSTGSMAHDVDPAPRSFGREA